jgi:hypothetical protein
MFTSKLRLSVLSIATALTAAGCGGTTEDANGDTSTQPNLTSAPAPAGDPLTYGPFNNTQMTGTAGGVTYTATYNFVADQYYPTSTYLLNFSITNTQNNESMAIGGAVYFGGDVPSGYYFGITNSFPGCDIQPICFYNLFTFTSYDPLPQTLTVGDAGQIASGYLIHSQTLPTPDTSLISTVTYTVVPYSSIYVGLVEVATYPGDNGTTTTMTTTYAVGPPGALNPPLGLISIEIATTILGTPFDLVLTPVTASASS